MQPNCKIHFASSHIAILFTVISHTSFCNFQFSHILSLVSPFSLTHDPFLFPIIHLKTKSFLSNLEFSSVYIGASFSLQYLNKSCLAAFSKNLVSFLFDCEIYASRFNFLLLSSGNFNTFLLVLPQGLMSKHL